VIWLGSKTGLEQVSDDLKWLGSNGKNGRLDDKDELRIGSLVWIEPVSLTQTSEN
jgi:hypothetical protein